MRLGKPKSGICSHSTLNTKIVEELKAKAEGGEATAEDAIAALVLAAIMGKENTNQKDE